jgi:hypothetical protein
MAEIIASTPGEAAADLEALAALVAAWEGYLDAQDVPEETSAVAALVNDAFAVTLGTCEDVVAYAAGVNLDDERAARVLAAGRAILATTASVGVAESIAFAADDFEGIAEFNGCGAYLWESALADDHEKDASPQT